MLALPTSVACVETPAELENRIGELRRTEKLGRHESVRV
jgi:hypothetical protein